jgi:hypothetical protein
MISYLTSLLCSESSGLSVHGHYKPLPPSLCLAQTFTYRILMLSNFRLEYSLSRQFTLRYLNVTFIILAILWTTLVTLISIASVGYETVTIQSKSFNASSTLWYEKLFPSSRWIPQSRTCDASAIKKTDCTTLGSLILKLMIIVLATTANMFSYTSNAWLTRNTGGSDESFDQFTYRNYPFRNCSVGELQLYQLNTPLAQTSVSKLTPLLCGNTNGRRQCIAIHRLISLLI